MLKRKKESLSHQSVLIFNKPNVITDNNFYMDVFRIPEVLNRLRQYRDILNENGMSIPIWVYCLTQDIKSLMGSPQPSVLNFLINLGLFDRYIAKRGWPQYILGSDPIISVVTCEISFEEQVLLLTNSRCHESGELQLYRARSYFNRQTGSFCLTSLKREQKSHSLKEILLCLEKRFKTDEELSEWAFQMLSPHEGALMDGLKSNGLFPREFLEWDQGLKWLWPIWKRTQMQFSKNQPVPLC